ncbi:DUF6515 family protein [Pseudomonas sp. H9]|uniref:DUF6515 family protein n=1 Tax=Pseudomonas sp. H9 TaxID=483968 RepID=UPI0010580D30|nr:DUF6515 family protein [Pseudomonas sp. H9]TDF85831.1 glycine zipper family protein [Pseudomonas sp. H9]
MKLRVKCLAVLCASLTLPVGAQEQGSSPLQSRPDEVRQTQAPRPGYYQDIPRRHYQAGQLVDRFPDQYWRVPYRGQDYFYSGGYWYRPQGPQYVVVKPPYGVRIGQLPNDARQVRIDGVLYFLAADTYYQYQQGSREFMVVNPQGNSDDVIAYPAAGQSTDQQARDRYECDGWAQQQAPGSYQRALGACLKGRGYSIN